MFSGRAILRSEAPECQSKSPERMMCSHPSGDVWGNDRYGCEIIAEKVDFLSRPKSAENENPELVDRDDEIPF